MRKVLLLIESYPDLVQLESMLKRTGFDVVSMNRPVSLSEKLLSLAPDAVVMTGRGTKVNGVELSQKIKKHKGYPKIILLFPENHKATAQDMKANMDLIIELPIEPLRFLQQLSNLVGLDAAAVLEKFAKLKGVEEEVQSDYVTGGPPPPEEIIRVTSTSDRTQRYNKIAQSVKLANEGGLDKQKVQAAIKEERKKFRQKDETSDDARRSFVRALFSKVRGGN